MDGASPESSHATDPEGPSAVTRDHAGSGPGPLLVADLESLATRAGLDASGRDALIGRLEAVVNDAIERTTRTLAADYEAVLAQRTAAASAEAVADVAHHAVGLLSALDQIDALLEGSDFARGTRALHTRLDRLFQALGCTRVATVGEAYDPDVHESVGESDDGPAGIVLREVAPGYRRGAVLVRAARVIVGRA